MEQASTSSGGQDHPFSLADLSTIQTDEFVSNTSDHSDSDSDSDFPLSGAETPHPANTRRPDNVVDEEEATEDEEDEDDLELELEHEELQAEKSDDEPGPPPFPPLNPFMFPGVRAPIEAYREMTLACRFSTYARSAYSMPKNVARVHPAHRFSTFLPLVPTDQWLTTRVDRAWTVGQVKLHMLTKIWGGRRYQLSLSHALRRPKRSYSQSQSQPVQERVGLTSISSSNYSSVLFAPSMMSEGIKSTYTFDNTLNASNPSLVQTIPPVAPDGGPGDNSVIGNGIGGGSSSNASGSSGAAAPDNLLASPGKRSRRSMSTEGLRGRSTSSSSSRRRRSQSIGGSGKGVTSSGGSKASLRPSASLMGDLKREEAMDRLYERMEAAARRKVLKAARRYKLVSFSNGNVLDDKDRLEVYGIKPYELLEIQPIQRCIRLARPTYLEPYFETDSMVRTRGGGEKHGIEFIRRLRQLQKEEKVKSELAKNMAALGLKEGDQNRPGEWGTGLSAIARQKNLEEKREEVKRQFLLEQAKKEEEKKARRERKDAESEKWKFRKLVVEGNDLNIWKDPLHDTFPEQSWDLRRVIEVQIPRPKEEEIRPSGSQTAYAALALSSNLQSVSTRAPEKSKAQKNSAKEHLLSQPTLHIRFSIPLASVYASLNPAAAAAIHAARLKRAAKANPGSTYLAESLASLGTAATRRLDSTDPYNQGIGFGTSTLEGAGTASLVLRLPDERTREHLCRIIHRSAGKYPLITKSRRKLAFEPDQDLVAFPDPDPERRRAHGAPFPEWRARVLKKAIASGRSGFLSSSAWNAVFNEATGLYCRPLQTSGADEKGKGSSLTFVGSRRDGYEGDEEDDDNVSLASDTEWEGWRRELELDPPPRQLSTIPSSVNVNSNATSTPKPRDFISHERSESAPAGGNLGLSAVSPEQSAQTDEEARVLTPIPHKPGRKGSLRLAKKMVVDGVAGKGLIIPRTNAYASWTSFSSNSSLNSSFNSHEDHYRSGDGSDTNTSRKTRFASYGGTSMRSGGTGGLSRAKSASTFPLRPSVNVPVASISAPLSATIDSREIAWSRKGSDASDPPPPPQELLDEYLNLGSDGVLPGMGGGLGNMFPAYADLGTTVTTIVSGRKAIAEGNSGKGTKKPSLRSRISQKFTKSGDLSNPAEGSSRSAAGQDATKKSPGPNMMDTVRTINGKRG
ncbi:hypothetical protein CPB86DRAFT_109321 [Serendipita vermifera]|nr:hypothetical protein CPB86DRAFT_109321 [Serendipita vermifera]